VERSRIEVVETARSYIGTRWRHQGRDRRGLDCVGLVLRVAHDLGLTDFDVSNYGRVPSNRMMERVLSEQCEKTTLAEIESGDILHLAFEKQPQHLAIVSDVGIIHADNEYGVIEHSINRTWRMRVRGCYRMPGL